MCTKTVIYTIITSLLLSLTIVSKACRKVTVNVKSHGLKHDQYAGHKDCYFDVINNFVFQLLNMLPIFFQIGFYVVVDSVAYEICLN